MSGLNYKRINKELQTIQIEIDGGENHNILKVNTINDDLTHWTAVIKGPSDTSYEKGIFKLDISFPSNFPFQAPKIKFLTKIYHPNVSNSGDICLDILKDQWSPALSVSKVLLSICALMSDPNANDPLNGEVANVFRKDKNLYEQKVREHVENFCEKL